MTQCNKSYVKHVKKSQMQIQLKEQSGVDYKLDNATEDKNCSL